VVMDVAYRMAPETDMMGMIHDAKRAIAWMKESGSRYGIHPDKIIIGGGSAGGHLALMAAYTAHEYVFTPIDLEGKDITVDSVISLYGPSDLTSMYYHLNQHLTTRSIGGKSKKAPPTQMPGWLMRKMGKEYYRLHMEKGFANAGAFVSLFGCHPDECPQPYSLFSPLTHVNSACPPTLLIQGEHDVMAPVESTRTLYARLMEQKVPVIMHILPQTDHAFDLILPKISASAHNAIYDIERFLASRSKSFANNHVMSEENEDHQLHYA